jgi:YegS/Rv2252/BmrU family lipid kinase
LNRVFSQHDTHWNIAVTHQKGDGAQLARQAVADGVDLVAAYGGDGTVGEVAAGLIESDVPLAILPGGTANALATGLGIAANLETAVAQIFTSTASPLDMGKANGETFILRADMGLTVQALASRDMKDRLGILAYVTATIEALGNLPQIHFSMSIDDQSLEADGIACIVTNHNALGTMGLNFGPRVDPGDGLLDMFVVGSAGDAVSAVASGLIQLQGDATVGLHQWQGRTMQITADPPQVFGLDGDEAGETPVEIETLPQAVQVLTPGQ